MEELKKKIQEYDNLLDELTTRALKGTIEQDSKDWYRLDELKEDIKHLALLI
jgi:hypothetical protein